LAPRGKAKVKKKAEDGGRGIKRGKKDRESRLKRPAGGIEEHSPQGPAGKQPRSKRATLGAPFGPELRWLGPRTMPESPYPP